MNLPAIQLAVFIIHHTAFDAFIEKMLGFNFDYILATRMPAGSVVEYHATGIAADAHQSVRDKAAKLLGGKRVNDPQIILDVLVDGGAIPPGTYRIDTRDVSVASPKPGKPWKTGRLKIVGMQV